MRVAATRLTPLESAFPDVLALALQRTLKVQSSRQFFHHLLGKILLLANSEEFFLVVLFAVGISCADADGVPLFLIYFIEVLAKILASTLLYFLIEVGNAALYSSTLLIFCRI